jgi:hypothetical protein
MQSPALSPCSIAFSFLRLKTLVSNLRFKVKFESQLDNIEVHRPALQLACLACSQLHYATPWLQPQVPVPAMHSLASLRRQTGLLSDFKYTLGSTG